MERINLSVQRDHILALTKFRTPIVAIEELIWNALDANATKVDVKLALNSLDRLDRITVMDNGDGILLSESRTAFKNIGGSPKLQAKPTRLGRRPHGKSGRGRLKAFGLGQTVKWTSSYKENGKSFRFTITSHRQTIDTFEIGDVIPLNGDEHGVTVEVTALEGQLFSLRDIDAAAAELGHRLALYLNQYPGITIVYGGKRVDPSIGQSHTATYNFPISIGPLERYDAEMTVIEWNYPTNRALYLCDRDGFAREEKTVGIKAKGWEFTAYLKSELVEKLDEQNALGMEELHPSVKALTDAAKDALRTHFRKRERSRASELVNQWQAEQIYPYSSPPADPIETAQREVFDVCAMNVHEYLPDFENLDRRNKLLTFKLIRQGLEANPSSVQTILREVLALPQEKQDDLAKLLERTKLSAIINAAKIIVDRLNFLCSMDDLLYGEFNPTLNEPRQLHPIISSEMWLFGEQYAIGADEQSLKSVLASHVKILGRQEIVTDVKTVTDLDGRDRFLDLLLYRQYPQSVQGQYEHLVVELKRPSINLGKKEISQIRDYAYAVECDDRFDTNTTQWTFLLVGNNLDDYAQSECRSVDRKFGHIRSGRVNIWVRPWADLLAEAKWRYDFFRKRLQYEATTEDALGYLREKYSQYFPDGHANATATESTGNGEAKKAANAKKHPAKKKKKRA
jgi:Histidine kinase-, DNA gyrase B-, and HSP90-like ATPase